MQFSLSRKEIIYCSLASAAWVGISLATGVPNVTLLHMLLTASFASAQVFFSYSFAKVARPYVIEAWKGLLKTPSWLKEKLKSKEPAAKPGLAPEKVVALEADAAPALEAAAALSSEAAPAPEAAAPEPGLLQKAQERLSTAKTQIADNAAAALGSVQQSRQAMTAWFGKRFSILNRRVVEQPVSDASALVPAKKSCCETDAEPNPASVGTEAQLPPVSEKAPEATAGEAQLPPAVEKAPEGTAVEPQLPPAAEKLSAPEIAGTEAQLPPASEKAPEAAVGETQLPTTTPAVEQPAPIPAVDTPAAPVSEQQPALLAAEAPLPAVVLPTPETEPAAQAQAEPKKSRTKRRDRLGQLKGEDGGAASDYTSASDNEGGTRRSKRISSRASSPVPALISAEAAAVLESAAPVYAPLLSTATSTSTSTSVESQAAVNDPVPPLVKRKSVGGVRPHH